MKVNLQENSFHSNIVELILSSRKAIVQTVNRTMVLTYFQIGKMIVLEEQKGKERAEYGKEVLKSLSFILTKEFGKGFSVDNLENMRRFFIVYKKSETLSRVSLISNSETLSRKSKGGILSWSHYLKLMRIEADDERN